MIRILRHWRKVVAAIGIVGLVLWSWSIRISEVTKAAEATSFDDTFTDSDGTSITAHSPDTGAGYSNVINQGESGHLQIQSNQLAVGACTTSDGVGYAVNLSQGEYADADYSVQVTYAVSDTADDYAWIGLRIQSNGDGYWVEWNADDSQIYSASGGTFTAIGSAGAGVAQGSVVLLQMTGSSIAFYDDGAQVISTTSATHTDKGRAGIGMGALDGSGKDCSGQELDNFKVFTEKIEFTCQTKAAGTGGNDTGVGTLSWSNEGNIASSNDSDATAATDGNTSEIEVTNYLTATSMGFNLSNVDEIKGITVSIERACSDDRASESCTDNRVRLIKGGTVQSAEDKANTVATWGETDSTATYGNSSDLWGNTWTESDIEATGFGVAMSVNIEEFVSVVTASVDYIEMQVCYTESVATARRVIFVQ